MTKQAPEPQAIIKLSSVAVKRTDTQTIDASAGNLA